MGANTLRLETEVCESIEGTKGEAPSRGHPGQVSPVSHRVKQ